MKFIICDELDNHLKSCAGCRRYRDEIADVSAVLATGKALLADIEPRETTRMRWAQDFESAVGPTQLIAARVFRGFLDLSREIVWPCRRIWAGMAAVWIVILGLTVSQRATEKTDIAQRASRELMRALLVHEGFVAGPTRTEPRRDSRQPRPPTPQSRNEGRNLIGSTENHGSNIAATGDGRAPAFGQQDLEIVVTSTLHPQWFHRVSDSSEKSRTRWNASLPGLSVENGDPVPGRSFHDASCRDLHERNS